MVKSYIEALQLYGSVAEKNVQAVSQIVSTLASNNAKLFSEYLNCFQDMYKESFQFTASPFNPANAKKS